MEAMSMLRDTCSTTFFGDATLVQPSAQVAQHRVCLACATTCLAHLTVSEDDEESPFRCACTSAGGMCLFSERFAAQLLEPAVQQRVRSALHQARAAQRQQRSNAPSQQQPSTQQRSPNYMQMQQRIRAYSVQALQFVDPMFRRRALEVVPLSSLLRAAREKHNTEAVDSRDALVQELLAWFKKFFSWVNQPPCEFCQHEKTTAMGMVAASAEELKYGANRVEAYSCPLCSSVTRFPRYNHAVKLLETRRGRCGEWAKAFTLCCAAVGVEARLVVDWTDHVWTEVWSQAQSRWVHTDSCEKTWDAPLMYESGWGKKLNYAVAFCGDEVVDVTRRYTQKWPDVLSRRNLVSEAELQGIIRDMNEEIRTGMPLETVQLLESRIKRETEELQEFEKGEREVTPSESHGRQSGALAWRLARGEIDVQALASPGVTASSSSAGTHASSTNATEAIDDAPLFQQDDSLLDALTQLPSQQSHVVCSALLDNLRQVLSSSDPFAHTLPQLHSEAVHGEAMRLLGFTTLYNGSDDEERLVLKAQRHVVGVKLSACDVAGLPYAQRTRLEGWCTRLQSMIPCENTSVLPLLPPSPHVALAALGISVDGAQQHPMSVGHRLLVVFQGCAEVPQEMQLTVLSQLGELCKGGVVITTSNPSQQRRSVAVFRWNTLLVDIDLQSPLWSTRLTAVLKQHGHIPPSPLPQPYAVDHPELVSRFHGLLTACACAQVLPN